MSEKTQWKKFTPGAPIIKNLQIIVESLKCVIAESIRRDAETIKKMAEHLRERPEIEKQLTKGERPNDLAGI